MFAQSPQDDDKIDECLDRIDGAMEKITKWARKAKATNHTPLNGFKPERFKKTRMAFQAMSESSLVTESGDDILLESRDDEDKPRPTQLKPTVLFNKKKAKRATG